MQVDSRGLGLFRILFCISLLGEVLTILNYRHVIYDPIPFIQFSEVNFGYLILIWIIALILLIFGYQTRIAAVVNYVMTLSLIGTSHNFEYHIFYTYLSVGFLFMFIGIDRGFSVDAWLAKRNGQHMQTSVPFLHKMMPLFFGIGTIYFNSFIHKLSSPIWMHGLGLWLPSSVSMLSKSNLQWLLDKEYFCYVASWLVLFYEACFFVLVWFRKVRLPLFLIGIPFHIGILLLYPIPWFALSYITVLTLLLPDTIWKKSDVFDSASFSKDVTSMEVSKFAYIIPVILFLELNCLLGSGIFLRLQEKLGMVNGRKWQSFQNVSKKLLIFSTSTLGINKHDVFMDFHFTGYNHNIALVYVAKDGKKSFIPVTNENGHPGKYLIGFNWAKWGFRSNGTYINPKALEDGIQRYSAYFLVNEELGLERRSHFEVVVKKFDSPTGWEKGFLTRMDNRPWRSIGYFDWEKRKMTLVLPDIEATDVDTYPLFVK